MFIALFPKFPFLALLAFLLFGTLVVLGEIHRQFRLDQTLFALSSEGCVATATFRTVRVYDSTHLLHLCIRTRHSLRTLLWSPDGTRLATVSREGVVNVWDAGTGYSLHPPLILPAPDASVTWLPASHHLVSNGLEWPPRSLETETE